MRRSFAIVRSVSGRFQFQAPCCKVFFFTAFVLYNSRPALSSIFAVKMRPQRHFAPQYKKKAEWYFLCLLFILSFNFRIFFDRKYKSFDMSLKYDRSYDISKYHYFDRI